MYSAMSKSCMKTTHGAPEPSAQTPNNPEAASDASQSTDCLKKKTVAFPLEGSQGTRSTQTTETD